MKIYVEFDSIEQASRAVAAVSGSAPVLHTAPAPATPPINHPPQPGYTPPAPPQTPPQNFAPPPGAPMPGQVPPQPQAGGVPGQPAVYTPPDNAAPAHNITLQQLTAAAQAYAKVHKPAGTKAKLGEFGITKVSEAHPSIYPQLLQALTVQ